MLKCQGIGRHNDGAQAWTLSLRRAGSCDRVCGQLTVRSRTIQKHYVLFFINGITKEELTFRWSCNGMKKKNKRVKLYHRHTTGQLSWFQPLAQESRSTSQFVTAPRFCFCCSSGAVPPPRRCLSGRGASLRKIGMGGVSHVKILYVPVTFKWIKLVYCCRGNNFVC